MRQKGVMYMLTSEVIDETELINRARLVLENYELQKELAKRNTSIGSPDSDGMPKGSKRGNPNESKILKQVNAQEYCNEVENKINQLDQVHSQILRMRFLEKTWNRAGIANKLNISPATYDRNLKRALRDFALSCDLVVIPIIEDVK